MAGDWKSEYARKFLDPRWQKKRLDVFQRDSFTCQGCYSTDDTLHVHHLYYQGRKDPWDYPMSALLTLCADCHESEEIDRREAEQRLLLAIKKSGGMAREISLLANAFASLALPEDGHPGYDGPPVALLAWHIEQSTRALRDLGYAQAVQSKTGEFYERYWKPFDERAKGFRFFPSEAAE